MGGVAIWTFSLFDLFFEGEGEKRACVIDDCDSFAREKSFGHIVLSIMRLHLIIFGTNFRMEAMILSLLDHTVSSSSKAIILIDTDS